MSALVGSSPPVRLLGNRYRLLSALAEGGMAVVYRGQDTLLNRPVAVKLLRDAFAADPQFAQRFRQEAQAAANLNHPNVVTIYDVGRDEWAGREQHYIVMELVDGQDLKQFILLRMAAGQPLRVQEAVSIARQVCEGVGHAHQRGLVHCDIKPQNILITPDGRAKVTDFGIARAYAGEPQHADMVWGSPHYYSPEQAAGHAPTPASDVYSIGVLLFELLTGNLPFRSDDPAQLAYMHLTAAPPPIQSINPAVPAQLARIVLRALAKAPAQRYQDANQLAQALAQHASQGQAETLVNLPAARSPFATLPIAPLEASTTLTPPGSQPSTALDNEANRAPDVLLWLLAAVAFLCVIGLVPLYVLVYQAYQTPAAAVMPITPAPTAPPTASPPVQIMVPDLAGQSPEAVQAQLAALGLGVRVVEERIDLENTTLYTRVVAQRPAAGTLVASGTVVDIVVSKPAEGREVPDDLVGKILDDALVQSLGQLGWSVVVTEAVDFLAEGTILRTEPTGGTKLAAGQRLTLTVSTGGRIVLNVDMRPVVLESVTLPRPIYAPGQTLQFRVRWRATGPVRRDYNVGWYLFTPDRAAVVAQGDDRAPRHNGLPAPTSLWVADTVVEDTYALRIPDGLPPGAYPLVIGMYAGAERLAVAQPGRAAVMDNLVILYTIGVR
jgi:serine/threonine protein kinase